MVTQARYPIHGVERTNRNVMKQESRLDEKFGAGVRCLESSYFNLRASEKRNSIDI